MSFVNLEDFNPKLLTIGKYEQREGGAGKFKFGAVPILYKYPNEPESGLRIRYPLMITTGISRKVFDDKQGPKESLGTRALLPEEKAKLDEIRTAIIKKLSPLADKEDKENFIEDFEDIDLASKKNGIKPFWSVPKDKKSSPPKVWFKVKPWSAFHVPDKKGSKGTKLVPHKKLIETKERRLDIEQRVIHKIDYFYLGQVNAVVSYFDQSIIKSISERGGINDQVEEAENWDFDNSVLDGLAEIDIDDARDESDSDDEPKKKKKGKKPVESDGSDEDDKPKTKKGIPKNFDDLLDDDDKKH